MGCKEACAHSGECNAINFNEDQGICEMRICDSRPVPPPETSMTGFKGYYIDKVPFEVTIKTASLEAASQLQISVMKQDALNDALAEISGTSTSHPQVAFAYVVGNPKTWVTAFVTLLTPKGHRADAVNLRQARSFVKSWRTNGR